MRKDIKYSFAFWVIITPYGKYRFFAPCKYVDIALTLFFNNLPASYSGHFRLRDYRNFEIKKAFINNQVNNVLGSWGPSYEISLKDYKDSSVAYSWITATVYREKPVV